MSGIVRDRARLSGDARLISATTIAGRRSGVEEYAGFIGDGVSTAITVTHNIGSRDVVVAVYDATTYDEVYGVVASRTTPNTVTISFADPPSVDQYRVVVIGKVGNEVDPVFETAVAGGTLWGFAGSVTATWYVPADLVVGAVLYAYVYIADSDAGVNVFDWGTAPSGWTQYGTIHNPATRDGSVAIYTRTVDGTESPTYSITATMSSGGTIYYAYACVQYSGVNTLAPIDHVTYTDSGETGPTSLTSGSVTPGAPGEILTLVWFAQNNVHFTTPPTGPTQRVIYDSSVVFNPRPIVVAYDTAAGPAGSPSATYTQAWSSAANCVAVAAALTKA